MSFFLRCCVAAAAFSAPACVFGQNPTSKILGSNDLSNVPTPIQSRVKPGALIVSVRRTHSPGFEDASAAAVAFSPSSGPVVIPASDLSSSTNGQLALTLFGFQPQAKLKSQGGLKYDQINMTGSLLTGDQMTALLDTDPDTKRHVRQWLLQGNHVYIVEGVFTTANLNITATGNKEINLSSGQAIDTCTGTPAGGITASTPPSTVPGGAVSVCHTNNNTVTLKADSPVPIALKIDEVHIYPDPDHPGNSHYDYVPAQKFF